MQRFWFCVYMGGLGVRGMAATHKHGDTVVYALSEAFW